MLRIGIGYDIHRLVKGRKLMLGGINIPAKVGLLGHSDADVLLHAICDALLGACGQGDIGKHFPCSDSAYKDISSIKLLKEVNSLLKKLKYSICNIDAVVIAEWPHLAAFKARMGKRIAEALKLSLTQVNVKATTAEGVGAIGKGMAISCYAVALIQKNST